MARTLRLPRISLRSALLGAVSLATLVPVGAAQIAIAPPRGLLGPGTGDSNVGGPGDRGDTVVTDGGSWTRWWTFNREPYLAQLRSPLALPVTAATLGGSPLAPNPARPAVETIHLEVVPELIAQLEGTRDLDLTAACLIALGKIGEPAAELAAAHELPAVADSILPYLKASNERVRDMAILALGLLEDARHATLLAAIARDEKDGRKAIKGRKIDRQARALATYALGHIGATTTRRSERAFVVHHLQSLADESRENADLVTAAALALAWSPLPLEGAPVEDAATEGRERTLALLYDIFEDSAVDTRGRAQIPVAIARLIAAPTEAAGEESVAASSQRRQLLREQAVVRFTDAITKKSRERNASVREGCVQALGILVADRPLVPDTAATQALLETALKGQDVESGLALIALGRLAGRASTDTARTLRREMGALAAEGSASQRAWALVALGVAEDRARAAGVAPALGTQALVESRLAGASSPSERSAAAISLGLAGTNSSAEGIADGLLSGDFRDRGLRALALALVEARQWMPAMQEIVSENIYRPYLLRDFATALALLGDRQLVDRLVFKLAQARFMPERVAALLALAWSDDPQATPALLFVLREKRMGRRSIDDISRAFAATALGTICRRSALPWNTRYALDLTWSAAPPSLTDRRNGGGVLDVL